MKLNSIILQNFKGIDNLEIKLDNKTTVIFGVNGIGKSTILQAIDLLYDLRVKRYSSKDTV